MRFQLRHHGWPIEGGRTLVPEGTIIDTAEPYWANVMKSNGDGVPPLNSIPLDQEAYDKMRTRYFAHDIFTIGDRIRR